MLNQIISISIAGLVCTLNASGIGSASSTVPISASGSPLAGGGTPFAGGAIPSGATPSFVGSSGAIVKLATPSRKFLDGIKGSVVKEFIALNPSYEDFNKDWTSTSLSINVSQGGNVNLKYFKVKDESNFVDHLTKCNGI